MKIKKDKPRLFPPADIQSFGGIVGDKNFVT
jgi:hypothetical protein